MIVLLYKNSPSSPCQIKPHHDLSMSLALLLLLLVPRASSFWGLTLCGFVLKALFDLFLFLAHFIQNCNLHIPLYKKHDGSIIIALWCTICGSCILWFLCLKPNLNHQGDFRSKQLLHFNHVKQKKILLRQILPK